MTAFLDFTISNDAFALGEALNAGAATHIELTRLVPVGETLVPYFWAETDDDDAVVSELLASSHVTAVETLDGAAGRSLFRVQWEEGVGGLLETLQAHDVTVWRAAGTSNAWKFQLIAEEREAFGAFQSACQETGLQITVTRLSSSVSGDGSLYGLTEKQLEALLRAYHAGYYDSDRVVELTELSEGLSISQQAFGARLKRGTGALIRNTIVVEDAL